MSEGDDLETAWSAVLEDWDDPARHADFVARCQLASKLGFAATKYRAVSGQNEAYRSLATRSEDARKRLGAITSLALIQLQTTAVSLDDNTRAMRWLKAVSILAFLLAALVLHHACSS